MIELAVAELEGGDGMVCSEIECEVEESESVLLLPMDRRRHLRRHGNWLPLGCYCCGLGVV